MKKTKLMLGDNITSLRKLPDNSIDSVVTDPPYGLSFMGKKWDYDVPSVEFWKEVWRVLKPGGHVLSFGGTRTYHRMVVNIEDAGFEIRDQIMWIYGSGFPKSHNIGKAVDKLEGNEREVVGTKNDFALDGRVRKPESHKPLLETINSDQTYGYKQGWDTPVTKGQSEYEGWGTALKPANEPICVARKPISEKSVAENVLKWKTGGINVDGCRVGSETIKGQQRGNSVNTDFMSGGYMEEHEGRFPANIIFECCCDEVIKGKKGEPFNYKGKEYDNKETSMFNGDKPEAPSNYNDKGDIHTNADCPCYKLDRQSGISESKKRKNPSTRKDTSTLFNSIGVVNTGEGEYNDKGGASRFFYVAKVSKKERNMGLDHFEDKVIEGRDPGQDERNVAYKKRPTPTKNTHPTVKPINLMTYLCRLVTPKNGIVLDPFMGSGSTGISAQLEGFRFVGMEMDEDYFKIAESRIENYEEYRKLIK